MPSYQAQNLIRRGGDDAQQGYAQGYNASAYNMRKWADELALMEKELATLEEQYLTNTLLSLVNEYGYAMGTPSTDTEKKLSEILGVDITMPSTGGVGVTSSVQDKLQGGGAAAASVGTEQSPTLQQGNIYLGSNALTGTAATQAAMEALKKRGYSYEDRYRF